MSNPFTQTLDLPSVLADPRTPPGMRAAAMAAMQAQKPQMPPGAQPQGAGGAPPPPMPMGDVTGPIRTGAALADQMRAPPPPPMPMPRMAMGGRVRGYADGGPVSPEDWQSAMGGADDTDMTGGGAGLSSMDPRFIGLIKQMMADSGKPTKEDKGLALAQFGFGMAASQSPHLGQAIGEGGTSALNALQKLRQERAMQSMKAAALGSSIQQHKDTLDQRREAAQWHHDDQISAIQQRADAAADRSLNTQLSIQQRAQAAQDHNDLQQQLFDFKKSQAPVALPVRQPGQSNEEYLADLQSVDPSIAAQAQAVANYQMQIPGSRNGKPNPIAMAAFSLNPSLDAKQYKARNEVVTDFAKGKAADASLALNRLTGHLGSLYDNIADLGNSSGITGALLNAPTNLYKDKILGDPAVNDFRINALAAASELRKVMATQGGGGLEELKSWERGITPNMQPEKQVAAVNKFTQLMDSQVDALANKWNRVMPDKKTAADLFDPEARAALAKINPKKYGSYVAGDRAVAPPGAPAPTPGTPAPVAFPPPPPAAVADLKANPASAAHFDEIFGPGAAKKVLGQ